MQPILYGMAVEVLQQTQEKLHIHSCQGFKIGPEVFAFDEMRVELDMDSELVGELGGEQVLPDALGDAGKTFGDTLDDREQLSGPLTVVKRPERPAIGTAHRYQGRHPIRVADGELQNELNPHRVPQKNHLAGIHTVENGEQIAAQIRHGHGARISRRLAQTVRAVVPMQDTVARSKSRLEVAPNEPGTTEAVAEDKGETGTGFGNKDLGAVEGTDVALGQHRPILAWARRATKPDWASEPMPTIVSTVHTHDHGDRHGHGDPSRRRLGLTMVVTCVLFFAEAVGGWWSGSLALLADAGHMLTDVLALAVAFAAISLAERPADARHTYGYRRLEILAALFNAVALVVVSGSIAVEAVDRWLEPRAVDFRVMGGVAAVGLLANLVGLLLLKNHEKNLNMRGAFLHVLGDALTSVGVLIGAGLIWLTGWTRVDPIISVIIAAVIVTTSLVLLREVLNVLLEGAPRGIDANQVRETIDGVDGVAYVHDLHVWSIASNMPALSAHVVIADAACDRDAVLSSIRTRLRDLYRIDHSTLQIEAAHEGDCCWCTSRDH